jgi:hypothetical protein
LLHFRLRMYIIGRNIRWMVMILAAGTVWVSAPRSRQHLSAVFAMLAAATVYNLALYIIPWRRM